MAHYDARKAIHDPNPEPPPEPVYPPIRLDVERAAKRVAANIGRLPPDQWEIWVTIYVDRLFEHFEERHDAAELDAVAVRFIEAFKCAMSGTIRRRSMPPGCGFSRRFRR